jgi:methylmalonyl-CoA/ethylmalonyl-CoA epimerase
VQLVLDHVAIALSSIASALPTYELLTGATGSAPEHVPGQGVNVVFVGGGESRLELIEPVSPDSPVARFIGRRGSGLHHIAYRVPDLEATLRRLEAAGIRLIDSQPREGAHGRRVAFVHPSAMHGVLVELVEAPPG